MIIDISNELLTDLKLALPNVTVLSAFQDVLVSFPTVIVTETDNTDDGPTKDSGGVRYNNISYEVEIYTRGSTRVSQGKKIRGVVNDVISTKYGMLRNSSRAVPNFLDESIHRFQLRYSGKINQQKVIYRG